MEKELVKYGLSEKEAKIYLICLKQGEATANRIIKHSKLARGTTYDILERLKSRGLISNYVKKHTLIFKVNDPEILLKEIEEKKTEIKKFLPKLKSLINTGSSPPTIEIFEGLAGVKKILDDILKNKKETWIMANEKNAREITKHHPENFKLKRKEKKIRIRNLLEESQVARSLKNDRYSEVRYTKALKQSKEVLIIYGNVTAHILMEEQIKIIKISSKEYTKTQRLLFETLWNNAKQ